MKFRKSFYLTIAFFTLIGSVLAQKSSITIPIDTAALPQNLSSIEVVIVNANQTKTTGSNVNTINIQQIRSVNTGRDIPILLQTLPNVVTTSDAGNGIGYTGIRVRGSDATRTNVTINGVPINDAESQGTFWVNMPDLASSAGSITVQRGLGSSLSGAGAFGASVNVQTSDNNINEFQLSYGSYQSRKITAKVSSPNYQIKPNQFLNFSGRISNIASNGFIDRAKSDLWSYFTSASYKSNKLSAKLLVFGGTEKTYQAWWGIPIEKFNMGKSPSSADSQALIDHYWRNAGVGYTYQNQADSANLFNSNPNTYNYYRYNNETDNYQQHHAHLYLNKTIDQNQYFNATLYYTHGEGYFEQFRLADKLSKYSLPNIITGDTGLVVSMSNSDLVRQRWLRNDLIGANLNYVYNKKNEMLTIGLSANQYYGQHFGHVVKVYSATDGYNKSNIPNTYYRGTGDKTDISLFAKYKRSIRDFNYFIDLQARKVLHLGKGIDNDLRNIDFTGNYFFFNPKAGFTYDFVHKISKNHIPKLEIRHEISGSIGAGSKEPARSDFTDNRSENVPRPEYLIDYELGYEIVIYRYFTNKSSQLSKFNFNGYYMDYKDQLVLSGALNDVGTALRVNVAESYRAGLEIENQTILFQSSRYVGFRKANHVLNFSGNVSISENRIKSSPASWFDYGTGSSFDTVYNNAPIAYSPNFIGALGINYNVGFNKFTGTTENGIQKTTYYKNIGNLNIQYLIKSVGKQYLDNTGNESRSIGGYQFTEFTLGYNVFSKKHEFEIKIQGNNLSNQYFANNGYTWGYMYNKALTQEVFVFPTAMRNWNISLGYIF